MYFPAKTAPAIVTRFHAEMSKVLQDADVKKLMENQGGLAIGSTPDEMAAYLKNEIEKYAKVIKASGARAD